MSTLDPGWKKSNPDPGYQISIGVLYLLDGFFPLKVVTNEKGEAVGDVLTIIC